jgi:mRNA-degrading endonuclease YafQ of YafQ-DinJ toxin-antitoxin module
VNLDSLAWSNEALSDFADRKFSAQERARILRALDLLANNERHPSLRVHALAGNLAGLWSASVTDSIRIHFVRLPAGRKRLANISKHYED